MSVPGEKKNDFPQIKNIFNILKILTLDKGV